MTTWRSKPLGDGVDAYGPTSEIQNAFLLMCASQRQPVDFAVFSYYDLAANVVTVYFSPSAEKLANSFQATPCAKPINKEGFGLLAGDQRAWDLLFHAK